MTTIGKYEIIEEIGRGGFAVVYRAHDTKMEREVALKVITGGFTEEAAFVARFRQEARTAANLRHPNIVPVYDFGEVDGALYLAMALIGEGRTLRDLLEAEAPLELTRALAILTPLATALDDLHGQDPPLTHRDIKPANVLLDGDAARPWVVLTDFGLVRSLRASTELTQSGSILGTPAYMAPEQADSARWGEVTPRADLYALGVVAYQMCTGHAPFEDTSPVVVLRLHADKAPPDPREVNPDLPDAVAEVILKALAKQPEDRYPSAGAFARALMEALSARKQKRREKAAAISLPPLSIPAWIRPMSGIVVGILLLFLTLYVVRPVLIRLMPFTPTDSPTNTPTPTSTPTLVPSPSPSPTWPPDVPPPNASLHDTWTRPADGMVMVYVPGGMFQMGSTEGDDDEQPVHEVTLDGFWIDQTEVTVAQFRKFVNATGHQTQAEDQNWGYAYTGSSWGQIEGANWQHPQGSESVALEVHPVVQVSWQDAMVYCEWVGGRLPTEAEWEYAARGEQDLIYPWGDEFECSRGNFDDEMEIDDEVVPGGEGCDGYIRTAPVGSFPDGASWCDALDMAGNVWEWVADWYDEDYYKRSVIENPAGPEARTYRVLRGGSWNDYNWFVRAACRVGDLPTFTSINYGFRCSSSVSE